ncbi:epidermal growth factor receptor kinase substrate 8-like [Ruditapes philippinarum]|uniref:epidermal growth factor receptor kinase substrate 8-like n=1 Tax=Ruditapes philippinarum TaxID=129788 RepID=UPI00295C038C|nr:epidermal growth factor receptor kinase substrate 8-like [Ruditapes philippinarum]
MAAAHPGQYRGPCRRGIFALSSWKVPLKRPESLREVKAEVRDWKPSQKLMMKYKYDGNAASPLGKELSVKQKDVVEFVRRHDEHWIKVRNEQGEEGFVPDSYVTVQLDAVSSLPWLDQKNLEEKVKQESAEYKPYKSAYAPKASEKEDNTEDLSNYYCKVCDRQFNGPIPFNAHNNSKAHKEEVENQAEYN